MKIDRNKDLNPYELSNAEFNNFYQSYSLYLEQSGETPRMILNIKEVDICHLFIEVYIVYIFYYSNIYI